MAETPISITESGDAITDIFHLAIRSDNPLLGVLIVDARYLGAWTLWVIFYPMLGMLV